MDKRRRLKDKSFYRRLVRQAETAAEFAVRQKEMVIRMKQAHIAAKADQQLFFRYLVPSMLSMLAVSCYSFVDTYVVGKALGAMAVGAMGLCTPVLSFLYALGFLFGTGGGIRYAVRCSQGQQEAAAGVFTTALLSALAAGGFIILFGNLFLKELALFLGATAGNLALSMEYLRWMVSLAPFMIADIILNSFMRNEGHPTVSMVATLTGTGLNVILDFLFVLGFDWGMNGAAGATCLASIISVGINGFYACKGRTNLRLTKTNVSLKTALTISRLGVCSFVLEGAVAVITVIFVNAAGKRFGDVGVAAFSAIMTFHLVVYSLLNGVAQSMQPLVSMAHGQQDGRRMRSFLRAAVFPSVGIGVLAALPAFLLSRPLAAVFLSDKPEALALAAFGLRPYALAFLFMSVSILIGIYKQAKEDVASSLLILLGRSLVLPVVCLWVLLPVYGRSGVWFAIPAGEALAVLLALACLIREKRLPAVRRS